MPTVAQINRTLASQEYIFGVLVLKALAFIVHNWQLTEQQLLSSKKYIFVQFPFNINSVMLKNMGGILIHPKCVLPIAL